MTTPPSAAAVNSYHTLASVAGAPQLALSWASSASVVASVVSSCSLKPSETTVAPPKVSLLGGAATAVEVCTNINMPAASPVTRYLNDLFAIVYLLSLLRRQRPQGSL